MVSRYLSRLLGDKNPYIKTGQLGNSRLLPTLLGTTTILVFWLIVGSMPALALYIINDHEPSRGTWLLGVFISCIFLITGIFFSIVVIHNRPLLSVNGHNRGQYNPISIDRIIISGMIWIVGLSVLLLIDFMVNPGAYKFSVTLASLGSFCILAFVIFFQSTAEELLFRGYLLQSFGILLRKSIPYPFIIGTLVTSIIFSLSHLANASIGNGGALALVYYLIFGIIACVITLIKGRLEWAIGLHFGNNLFTSGLATFASNGPGYLFTTGFFSGTPALFWIMLSGLFLALFFFTVVLIVIPAIKSRKAASPLPIAQHSQL